MGWFGKKQAAAPVAPDRYSAEDAAGVEAVAAHPTGPLPSPTKQIVAALHSAETFPVFSNNELMKLRKRFNKYRDVKLSDDRKKMEVGGTGGLLVNEVCFWPETATNVYVRVFCEYIIRRDSPPVAEKEKETEEEEEEEEKEEEDEEEEEEEAEEEEEEEGLRVEIEDAKSEPVEVSRITV